MAELRKVDELESPPIVGEDYLVLSIQVGRYFQPVFAVAHADHVDPDFEHYHPDRRFLSEEIVSGYSPKALQFFGIINPFEPSWHQNLQNKGLSANERPAEYRRFTCLRDLPPWRGPARHFLAPTDHCAKARWTDGKPHCPHQGLQLAQFWDGEAETIRCPLHGLLVDMRGG